ncbi:hypothetical protein MBSD_n1977 [Mizugakiibacter sediminis]|uniref:Alginate export domain-containing protein n=1 Tax=Mizugakiibacter sediminis TaxID=1475481 RepID=A0A0K8QPS0_9GAMM|nr:alginate export family protein [Mizugakiibacter sediminis]GAP66666.1 hypothetical protein MBSD_n1977 [Mizugakiibacter sediminis]
MRTIGHLAALAALCAATAAGAAAGSFGKTFRYDDDFSALCAPGARASAAAKCLPFGRTSYLSLGADLRLREEAADPPRVVAGPAGRDAYLLRRILAHADLHLGAHARAFVQLGNHQARTRNGAPKATDRDGTDLSQAFVDLSMRAGGGRLTWRLGRQEMNFGAGRLVSVRNTANARRSFDGAAAILESGAWDVRAFAARPVLTRAAAWDDIGDQSQALWGVYARGTRAPALELYYLGFLDRRARFAGLTGEEQRHTLGARWTATRGAWDADVEGTGQLGRFRDADIRAFALYGQGGYTWRGLPGSPRLGLRADAIGGDRHPRAGALGTFNPLYATGTYFGQNGLFAAANLIDLAPSLRVTPRRDLMLELSHALLWRYSARDASYTPALTPLVAADAAPSRRIGTQTQLAGSWRVDRHVLIETALLHFAPAAFARAGRARSQNFAMASLDLRY